VSTVGAARPGPAAWDGRRIVAVATGGAAGAGVRWAVVAATAGSTGTFPWPVLAVNVVGSLLLGLLLASARPVDADARRVLLHDAGGIGFCGGLTTFSTFTVEIAALVRDGNAGTAAAYAVASVASGLAAVVVGAAALHRVRAVTTPLEEQP